MKKSFLTASLLTVFALAARGEDQTKLRSEIALKEKQLVELQQQLAQLKGRLASAPSGTATAKSYTVKTGDTIHSIARRYQVSPADLMKWNGIDDPTKLGIGETLTTGGSLPRSAPPTAAAPTRPAGKTKGYVVEKGDTFYSIARSHKMTLTELKALNPDVSTHLIAPGQTISVADKTTSSAPQPKRPSSNYQIKERPSQPVAVPAPRKPAPAPVKKPATAVEAPTQTKKAPVPPSPPILKKEPKSAASTIILDSEVTFEEFAQKHGTNTDTLNDLNGWNLPKSTVLARGSEIHIPN